MSFTIAFSGKGGTGKTTLAALAIKYLVDKKISPILAVDADPNANLNMALGMDFSETIADVREEIPDKKVPEGIAKNDFISRRMDEILVEGEDIDLLVMGRPEGPGCYCAVNHLLRDYLNRLSRQYKAVVMDSEAGMEHLSRRTTDDLDALFIVANPDRVSVQAASRIQGISQRLKLRIKHAYFVLNRVHSGIPEGIKEIVNKERFNLIGIVPEDSQLSSLAGEGRAIFPLSDSPARRAMNAILEKII